MMKKPSKSDFTLKKIKIKDGVHIEAVVKHNAHDQVIKDNFTFVPHPDLTAQFEKLKPALATTHGLLAMETFIDGYIKEFTPSDSEHLKKKEK